MTAVSTRKLQLKFENKIERKQKLKTTPPKKQQQQQLYVDMTKHVRPKTWNQEAVGSDPGSGHDLLPPLLCLRLVESFSSPSDEI